MSSWAVYRHTSPSGKIYIGITSRSPLIRWGKNGIHYSKNTHFGTAIKKYGWDNIKHEVLFTNLSEERAKQLEIDLIRHYKNLGISYNMTDGGDGSTGYCPSEETREKMRTAQRKRDKNMLIEYLNKNRAQIGIKHRKAVVQFDLKGDCKKIYECSKFAAANTNVDASMISACCKEKMHKAGGFIWMYKSRYEELLAEGTFNKVLKDLIEKALKVPGKYERTSEWRRQKSAALKGKDLRNELTKEKMCQHSVKATSKPVMQLTQDNHPIQVFRSISEANKVLSMSSGFISQCCTGKKKRAYGYKWKFITKEEYETYKTQFAA